MFKHDKLLHTMLKNYRCNYDKFRKKNILHCCFLKTDKFIYVNEQIVLPNIISLFIQFTEQEIKNFCTDKFIINKQAIGKHIFL